MSRTRKSAVATAAVLVVVIAGLLLPPIRTLAYAWLLVPELMAVPSGPLSALTPPPSRQSTTYGTPADRMDIYLPHGAAAGAALPAVILGLGVHPQPIDSPDVVQIAEAISRLGVVVGVPDSTALRNLDVTSAEPAHLADAVAAIMSRPEVDPRRVGLVGFSAGASMSLIAAADGRIADQLRFVSAFGGYADAERLLIDVATNTTLRDGTVTPWLADPGIRADITTLLTIGATSPADRQAITTLLSSGDRDSATRAIEQLSGEYRRTLAALSPINHAERVRAPVYLLHGRPDSAIPVEHAALLVDALDERVARFTEFGRFGHGQPGIGGIGPDEAGDVVALWLYLRDIVAATLE